MLEKVERPPTTPLLYAPLAPPAPPAPTVMVYACAVTGKPLAVLNPPAPPPPPSALEPPPPPPITRYSTVPLTLGVKLVPVSAKRKV